MDVLIRESELKQLLAVERNHLLSEIRQLLGQEKPKKNFNAKQAVDFMGISISTLYKSLHRIPHKRFGKKLLFSQKELEELRN